MPFKCSKLKETEEKMFFYHRMFCLATCFGGTMLILCIVAICLLFHYI